MPLAVLPTVVLGVLPCPELGLQNRTEQNRTEQRAEHAPTQQRLCQGASEVDVCHEVQCAPWKRGVREVKRSRFASSSS